MKRLIRRVFPFATGASALLAAAVVLQWVRSDAAGEVFRYRGARYLYVFTVDRGSAAVEKVLLPSYAPKLTTGHFTFSRNADGRELIAHSEAASPLGIAYVRLNEGQPLGWVFVVRLGLLTGLATTLPLLWLLWLPRRALRLARRVRGRKRHARGLCAACAYDLTGNLSGRCPECGAEVGR